MHSSPRWRWLAILILGSSAVAAPRAPTVVLVDKKTHTLRLAEYHDGEYKVLSTFHTTVGKVIGDKQEEGDQKTPEGIYFFTMKILPPQLAAKFGVMAFYMDYPNAYDKIAGRTGDDIMLHATNAPERLKQSYDSEGCVVLKNEDLLAVSPRLELNLSPILVFEDLTPEYLSPGKDAKLRKFFEDWSGSWSGEKIDDYIRHYHSDFFARGMNKAQWKKYKDALNTRYSKIDLGITDVHFYRHPKYSLVQFVQNYRGTLKNGKPGFGSTGTKHLFIAEEDGALKIISEQFTNRKW